MNKKDIKIFVTYKDKHKIIKSDIITPIQTGRAIADEVFEGMIGDDTGDNISSKNNKYCELTAQYWTWKNYEEIGNPNYIGFMHYRRHLIFDKNAKLPKEKWLNHSEWYKNKNVDISYFADDKILGTIKSNADCYLVKEFDYSKYIVKSIKDEFITWSPRMYDALVSCQKVVSQEFPEYGKVSKEILDGHKKFLCNMFVMKKELFFEYNEFLFKVLSKLENIVNSKYFTSFEYRYLGFCGEYLLTCFLRKKIDELNINIEYLSGVYIENTNFDMKIKPFFKDNYSVIGISSSNEYAPYLSTCLQSLKDNSSANHNYDILIFEKNMTKHNKEILKSQIECRNISLRFMNSTAVLSKYQTLRCQSCYTIESYMILMLPEILSNYDRILFTDCDLIFNADVKDLYHIDLKGKPASASQDIVMASLLNDPNGDWQEYCKKELELKDNYLYFNSGVMVYDLNKCREIDFTDKTLKIAQKKLYRTFMQCLLNKFFKDNVLYQGLQWNYTILNKYLANLCNNMPLEFKNEYTAMRNNAKIIHWAGSEKPWFAPETEQAELWWAYARKTPFYEVILKRMCNKGTVELFKDIRHHKKNVIKYWKYKILQNFVFGKTRARYVYKKHFFKAKVAHERMFR